MGSTDPEVRRQAWERGRELTTRFLGSDLTHEEVTGIAAELVEIFRDLDHGAEYTVEIEVTSPLGPGELLQQLRQSLQNGQPMIAPRSRPVIGTIRTTRRKDKA